MNPRYRFYLDGTLVPDPVGWDQWEGKVTRGAQLQSLLINEDGRFTFTGLGYSLLKAKRELGYCSTVEVLIEESCNRNDNWETATECLIFISDVKFNLTKGTAECTLEDNNFNSRIDNNRSIEVSINAGKTKNGLDITPLDLWSVLMFNPCDGSDFIGDEVAAYRLHDVGEYLINFMTDGLVGFRSAVLDIGGEFEGTMISKGLLMRQRDSNDVGILTKWEEYLRNACNSMGLAFRLDISGARPILVLELRDDIFVDSELLTFDNVYEIIRYIDQAKNYAAVELGTDDIIESGGCGTASGLETAFPDQINLIGCKKEQFAVTGTCNINSVLDLTLDWIVSSNVIENIFVNGDDRYDSSVIFLDCDTLDNTAKTARAIKGDVFGTSLPAIYNTRFFNDKVAQRHLRGIPSTLVKYLNAPVVGFKARNTGTEVITIPGTVVIIGLELQMDPQAFGDDFSLDGYDLNNDWGNGTTPGNLITQANSFFLSPFENVYRFKATGNIVLHNTLFANTLVRFTYKVYDPSNVLVASYPSEAIFPAGYLGAYEVISPLIFIPLGYKMFVQFNYQLGYGRGNNDLTIEMIAAGSQGGTFQVYNSEHYIADLYEVTVPMSMSQWNLIKQNPTHKLRCTDAVGNQVAGWIDSLIHNRGTGIAKIRLIAETTGLPPTAL